jgi:hypothetical protein
MRSLLLIVAAAFAVLVAESSLFAAPLSFEKDVRPVFKAFCLDCHGGDGTKANLDLRLKRFALKGGDTGPAFVAGNAAESLLIERMKSGEMPPGEKKVPPEQIAVIERWIAEGAATLREEPETLPAGLDITPEERAYWAFQPLSSPQPPAVTPADRARTAIDAFIVARLREHNLAFNPDADRRTLLRRASLDLTGLAPTAEETQAFLSDTSERAWENAVDRLLASPRYGERWARHWLDVVGYADSEGNGNEDTPRQFAYKFRDYVIRAFNADKPLNEFVIEQLAGDELVPRPWKELPPEQLDKLIATGFLRMVVDPTTTGGVDHAEGGNQVVADAMKVIGSSLLGLSVGCAQCHDHRYDPISQVDYFRLRAVFEPAFDVAHWRRPGQRYLSLVTDADREKSAAIEAEANKMRAELQPKIDAAIEAALVVELGKFPEDQREKLGAAARAAADKRTDEQKALIASNPKLLINPGNLYQYNEAAANEIKAENAKIEAKLAERPKADYIALTDETPGSIPPTHLFHRGDFKQPKQVVAPGDLTIATPAGQRFDIPEKDPSLETSGRRLAYAKHLTSGTHPLLARVLVNRVWLHHFGRGLVDTPGEFGKLGTAPSHPELLDWLASELPRMGWSLKALHRLMLTSTVYRQSSKRDATRDSVDSDGRLYSRFAAQRLDAEILRDRMLQTAGQLDVTAFGPAIPVAEDFVGQVLPEGDSARRSIYLQVRRTKPVSLLSAFDAPVMTVNCDRRVASTSAPQSLMLMNSDFILARAKAFAERLRATVTPDTAADVAGPLASRYPRPTALWSYGYGRYDEEAKRVAAFEKLPHFSGSSWQGGEKLPDEKLGYAIVHASGGHAGNDQSHLSIRRWTAPQAGMLKVAGQLTYLGGGCGDGVRGRVVSSQKGLLGEWTVYKGEASQKTEAAATLPADAATNFSELAVEAGETIDFAVDCRENPGCDSYGWSLDLKLHAVDGRVLVHSVAAADFANPPAAAWPQLVARAWEDAFQRPATAEELSLACDFLLDQLVYLRAAGTQGDLELLALTNLCQQLLSANEFLYID